MQQALRALSDKQARPAILPGYVPKELFSDVSSDTSSTAPIRGPFWPEHLYKNYRPVDDGIERLAKQYDGYLPVAWLLQDFSEQILGVRVIEKHPAEMGVGLLGFTYPDFNYVVLRAGFFPEEYHEVRTHEYSHRWLPVPTRYDEGAVRASVKRHLGSTVWH